MNSLLFATGNKGKFHTAFHVLKRYGINLEQADIEIDEIQGEDAAAIIYDKAQKAFMHLQKPLLVSDDSWLIHALNGFPGPYMKSVTHWFTTDDFMRLMHGIDDRSVSLIQRVVFKDTNHQQLFKNEISGQILDSPTDFPGPAWANVCTVTKDGRSIAEVRNSTPKQLAEEVDTVWSNVAQWLKENR